MTTFTPPSVSNYNASPPTDDGAQTSTNRVDWSKVKTKIGDPVKTCLESLVTQLTTLFGTLFNPTTETPVLADKLLFLDASDSNNLKGATLTTILGLKVASTVGSGCLITNSGVDADHDIIFGTGYAADRTNNQTIRVATALTKQIDAVWAAGTNAGGLDAGSVANSTKYSCWRIWKADGTVDALFSTAAPDGSPTMPTDYLYKEYRGTVITDGSANILPYLQSRDGKKFRLVTGVEDLATTSLGTSTLTTTATAPKYSELEYAARLFKTASAPAARIYGTEETDATPTTTGFPLGTMVATTDGGTAQNGFYKGAVMLDGSAQFNARSTVASTSLNLVTLGWIDHNIGA